MREDSKKILPDGQATPYVAIFDVNNNPILNPENGKPLGMYVNSFWYQYDEEEVDAAEITINIDNPDIVDHPKLQNRQYLKLQWGWVYSDGSVNYGPVRKVIIMDHESAFTEDGTLFTLKCNDPMVLLKKTPPDHSTNAIVDIINNFIVKGDAIQSAELLSHKDELDFKTTIIDTKTGSKKEFGGNK